MGSNRLAIFFIFFVLIKCPGSFSNSGNGDTDYDGDGRKKGAGKSGKRVQKRRATFAHFPNRDTFPDQNVSCE